MSSEFYFIWNIEFDSVSMQKWTDSKMEPLKTARQICSWFCGDVISESLSNYQVRYRRIFRFIFAAIFTAANVASNLSLFVNFTSMINTNIGDFFFAFYQFNMSLHAVSAFVTIYTMGPKLSVLFRNLENIYIACKNLLFGYKILAGKSSFEYIY